MRTKTLLLTAVLSAAGAATSLAQVYSVNAVGYINLAMPRGFSIIANQLDAGTGNNTVAKVIAAPPDGTLVYKWTGTGFAINSFDSILGGWSDAAMTLAPGEAVFINLPAAHTATLVGEVPQGALTTAVGSGFSMLSSKVPQKAGLSTVLGYPAADGDIIYAFDRDSNSDGVFDAYNIYSFDSIFGGWQPSEPQPNVGQGYWFFAGAAKTWSRTFSVNTP